MCFPCRWAIRKVANHPKIMIFVIPAAAPKIMPHLGSPEERAFLELYVLVWWK